MKKINSLLLLFTFVLLLSRCTVSKNTSDQAAEVTQSALPVTSPSGSTKPSTTTVDFTASFEIFTNGTKRIFTDAKYHNQSSDVYIESTNPSRIHVKKAGVRWSDFFETLPFSLTRECLVTGTNQTFCTSETKKLRFFLNGEEVPQALNRPIQAGDSLRVTYGM
jgi:hypothetical protein